MDLVAEDGNPVEGGADIIFTNISMLDMDGYELALARGPTKRNTI